MPRLRLGQLFIHPADDSAKHALLERAADSETVEGLLGGLVARQIGKTARRFAAQILVLRTLNHAKQCLVWAMLSRLRLTRMFVEATHCPALCAID